MTTRYSLFAKMMVIILALLIPVILMIGYSHQVSVNVVEKELQQANRKQLSLLLHQMDTSIEQLYRLAVALNRDPSVRDLPNLLYKDSRLDRVNTKKAVMEKLTLQSLSSNWKNELLVHSPFVRQTIGSLSSPSYDESKLQNRFSTSWRLETMTTEDGKVKRMFKRFVTDSLAPSEPLSDTKLVLEVVFDSDNISAMLSNYQSGERGGPLLYRQGEVPILGHGKALDTTQPLIAWLDRQSLSREGTSTLELQGSRYLVHYLKSQMLDWYLVDLIPMEVVLSPIYESRNYFLAAISALLVTGLVAAVLLYRNIQIPIRQLIKGFKRIRDRQFATRVPIGYSHEFKYMQMGFNEMASEIQRLVESVYEEKIRSRDARLKQLQAQVNPHFLYNCLAFITSMNEMENREAVASMAHNLGDYYRFTTRSDKDKGVLREELSIVNNYLAIQRMRMPRMKYDIHIPEEMKDCAVPRLFLQPIVENAVIHGIELKPGEVTILVSGSCQSDRYTITVDDNGVGLSDAQIREIENRLHLPLESDIGYGLWNTQHRLQLMFGKTSGIAFSQSPLGGLRVTIQWTVEDSGKGR